MFGLVLTLWTGSRYAEAAPTPPPPTGAPTYYILGF